jgi:hypothetical protein
MMESIEQNKFEGWAVVELFGHAKEIGFVTTQYFGPACLFQIDVPELPEREIVLARAEWIDVDGETKFVPIGSKVKRAAVPHRSRLVGPSAIYSMTPCTEETARKAIDEFCKRRLILLELATGAPVLPAPPADDDFLPGEDGSDEN